MIVKYGQVRFILCFLEVGNENNQKNMLVKLQIMVNFWNKCLILTCIVLKLRRSNHFD